MKKLTTVSRETGYPVTAEIIQVLNETQGYLECLLNGISNERNFAVLLTETYPLIAFVKPSYYNKGGKIVQLINNIPATSAKNGTYEHLLQSRRTYALEVVSQSIDISNDEGSQPPVFSDCILNECYEIIVSDTLNKLPIWHFYTLSEAIRRSYYNSWKYIDLEATGKLTGTRLDTSDMYQYDSSIYYSFVRYNSASCEIELNLNLVSDRVLGVGNKYGVSNVVITFGDSELISGMSDKTPRMLSANIHLDSLGWVPVACIAFAVAGRTDQLSIEVKTMGYTLPETVRMQIYGKIVVLPPSKYLE